MPSTAVTPAGTESNGSGADQPADNGPSEWEGALRRAALTGAGRDAIAPHVLGRLAAGHLTARQLRLVLLVGQADPSWATVRSAALAHLAEHGGAVALLHLHSQIEFWPPPVFQAFPARSGGIHCTVRIGLPPHTVTGPAVGGSTRSQARERAAHGLLAVLSDVCAPRADPAPRRAQGTLAAMGTDAFEELLARHLNSATPPPELADEIISRTAPLRLHPRHIRQLLLLTPAGTPWKRLRAAVLDAAAAHGPVPARVLDMHAHELGTGLLRDCAADPAGTFTATVGLRAPQGLVRSRPCSAATAKGARQVAAADLLARLAGVDDPSGGHARTAGAAQPLAVLNTLKQTGQATEPVWRFNQHGPAHQPEFTATVSCTVKGVPVSATGSGPSKTAARSAAAAAVLAAAQSDPRRTPTAPGSIAEALATGCALTTLTGSDDLLLYRGDGTDMPATPLPEGTDRRHVDLAIAHPPTPARVRAVAGWSIAPLAAARALLQVAGSPLHPSAEAWAAWSRLALEMAAAGALQPQVDLEGRDSWHIGPWTLEQDHHRQDLEAQLPFQAHCHVTDHHQGAPVLATAEQAAHSFLGALANALSRSEAVESAYGPVPYARQSPERLDPLQQQWADRTDPTPGPGIALTLTVREPLHADVHEPCLPVDIAAAWPCPAPGHRPPAATTALSHRRAVARAVRRMALLWPTARELTHQVAPTALTITADQAVELRALEQQLADENITITWPEGFHSAITTSTALTGAPAAGLASPRPAMGLERVADFRWRHTLDGQELNEGELRELASSAGKLIRIRGRWLIVDPNTAHTAAAPVIRSMSRIEAVAAALAGRATVDGTAYSFDPGHALEDLLSALRTAPEHDEPVPVPASLHAQLRPYQHRGLTWLARVTGLGFGAILADDMGLGKTLLSTALIAHRHEHGIPGPTLIVVKASLVPNWTRELARFAPTLPVTTYHGPNRSLGKLTDRSVVVTTYGVLLRERDRLAATRWGLLVADEAHMVNNAATATAQALGGIPAATLLAVTGTPVENNLLNFHALLDLTNPGLLGSPAQFHTRFGRPAETDPHGPAAKDLARITAPFLLRRLKTDPEIAAQLPTKTTRTHPVHLTREQIGLYEAAVADTLACIRDSKGAKRRGPLVRLLTALRQICNHPAHYLREAAAGAATDGFAARSGKLVGLDRILDEAGDQQVLVFTSYVAMGRLLVPHLTHGGRTAALLHGGCSTATRQRMIDAFQRGDTQVLVLSLKAAGEGLNLTAARHVVHYDRQWNPAAEDQGSDRAHRIGQLHPVTVHHLPTVGTLEEGIREVLDHKRALSSAVLPTAESALARLTDTALEELLTLREPLPQHPRPPITGTAP